MAEYQPAVYPTPQDKYGLLALWQEMKVPALLEQLGKILTEHKCQSVLDCTDGNDLYATRLTEHGWKVTTLNNSQENQKFDAVICMDDKLIRYQDEHDIVNVLYSMRHRLSDNGIFVFCLPDVREVTLGDQKNKISPLLLGEELAGKRCSAIRYRIDGPGENQISIDYIYHVEDLSTGVTTLDWEEVYQTFYFAEAFYDFVDLAGGYNHYDMLLGEDRIFVCKKRPYVGPKGITKRFQKTYDD